MTTTTRPTVTGTFRKIGFRRRQLARLAESRLADFIIASGTSREPAARTALNEAREQLAILTREMSLTRDRDQVRQDPATWLNAVSPELAARLTTPAELADMYVRAGITTQQAA